ncbi:MAG: bifunctional folylpolyglutamate synthase/dihydrofolate synthase [Dehalococcoidia bacterium]|nr:bifunctional folylpolyglutamate synthase/dihydrofolate synthase [Dehalococcoidia bacterium]
MDYVTAAAYLAGLTDYEVSPATAYNAANFDLRRVEMLLRRLGLPQRGRKTVHIAGTKGKGSTAAMLSSILTSAGYRTGLFTSPHLYTWQERIAVDGRPIIKKDFARLVSAVKKHVQAINGEGRFGKITTFEALTAVAFLYFRDRGANFQVLETGMGGRLDATNIADPDVCILTSISYDHTGVLGDTLSKIAGEKAGIIKPGCTVISAPQEPEALAVIKEKCRLVNSELILAGKDITWKRLDGNLNGQSFSVQSRNGSYALRIPLLGDYQMENASLAVAAAEALQQLGTMIALDHIAAGLKNVHWPARLQILKRAPLLVIDGAHNAHSMKVLLESVKRYLPYKKLIVIFGSSGDKDIEGMAKALAGPAWKVIVTSSGHPRAAAARQLAGVFALQGLTADIRRNAKEALSAADNAAAEDDLILATGSLFLAADIGRVFKDGNFR